jgi:hypothetical protein
MSADTLSGRRVQCCLVKPIERKSFHDVLSQYVIGKLDNASVEDLPA